LVAGGGGGGGGGFGPGLFDLPHSMRRIGNSANKKPAPQVFNILFITTIFKIKS